MDSRVSFPPFNPNVGHTWSGVQRIGSGSISLSNLADGIIWPGFGNTYLRYYSEGIWTPDFTNLIIVPGTGGATFTGIFERIGRLAKWQARIHVTSTCTVQGVLGNCLLDNLPITASDDDLCFLIDSNNGNAGIGRVQGGYGAMLPSFGPVNKDILISGTFYCAP